jgi:hypothetical protein
MVCHTIRDFSRDDPSLSLLPVPIPTAATVPLAGPRIAAFGISVQSPWSDIVAQREVGKSMLATSSKEGVVLLFGPGFEPDAAAAWRGGPPKQNRVITSVLGERELSSNYELLSAAVRVTPKQAHWWATRRENARVMLLVMQKGLAMTRGTNAIYEVAHGELRGFQFGDPDVAPYVAALDLFDSHDRKYTIRIRSKTKDAPSFTQKQVNAMVASIEISPQQP